MATISTNQIFANILQDAKPPKRIKIRHIIIEVEEIDKKIYDNCLFEKWYKFSLPNQENIEISIQLYENINDHHRLFCFNDEGMLFSINLTTKDNGVDISLEQKISFREGRGENDTEKNELKAIRKEKQRELCSLLEKLGFSVDNNNIELGSFDPIKKKLIDTDPEEFLESFMKISILKGHFQGNKGYELDIDGIFTKPNNSNSEFPVRPIQEVTPAKLFIEDEEQDEVEDEKEQDEIIKDIIKKKKTKEDVLKELEKLSMDEISDNKIQTFTESYKRNNRAIARIKFLRDYKCQICQTSIEKRNGQFYVEAAHIDPKREQGKETLENIILLCPNHHKEFDLGDTKILRRHDGMIIIEINGIVHRILLSI